jgi:hypothetical protein
MTLVGEEDTAAEQVGLARRYICRLSTLMRLMWPPTLPELHSWVSLAATASWSRRRPMMKECSSGWPVGS